MFHLSSPISRLPYLISSSRFASPVSHPSSLIKRIISRDVPFNKFGWSCDSFTLINSNYLVSQQITRLCDSPSLWIRPHPLQPTSASIHPASASTSGLILYIYPQPLHPASASTSGLFLYIHPQPLYPASASTSGLILYIHPQPLHPASVSTSALSIHIQPQSLHATSASTPSLNFYILPQLLHMD